MAWDNDTDSLLSTLGCKNPVSPTSADDGVSTVRTLHSYKSPDGRYLHIIQEQVIDLHALERMAHEDQYRQQTQVVRSLFSSVLDYKKGESFCNQLLALLLAGKIEWHSELNGPCYVNILKGNGQSDFFRLLLDHASPQKLKTLGSSEGFKSFKQLLRTNVRHFGQPLNNNSLGVTLHRLIDQL